MSSSSTEIGTDRPLGHRLTAVSRRFWDLGFTSFGGPGVHVIILRQRFVETLKWVDERTFLDLFALGNALPGPGSTQLAFSIAVVTNGVLPGLLAFLLWSLPGAIGMVAIGIGISRIPDQLPGPVLALFTGLNAAAVGLIALAAVQLGTAAGTDRITLALVWLSASFGICYHAPWMYPVLIAVGGLTTLLWDFRRTIWKGVTRLGRGKGNQGGDGQEVTSSRQSDIELTTVRLDRAQDNIEREQSDTRARTENSSKHDDTPIPYPSPAASPTPTRRRLPTTGEQSRASQETSIRQASITAVENGVNGVNTQPEVQGNNKLNVVSVRVAIALISGFVLLLAVPLATRAGLSGAGKSVPRALDFFCNLIIAGTIIFGGGPVVIPLLRDYVVVPGWVSSRDFLLVFAILQAFPGPNFNFAVALGFLACPGYRPLGALLGFIGIFSPGILLKLGLLPLYASWRDKPIARSIIRGLNASAAGLVFTAVWQLFLVGYIYYSADGQGANGQTVSGPLTADPFWAVVSSGAFLACRNFATPPWAAIPAGGIAGLAWYGVQTSRG